jgi:hypothetical protein
MQQDSDSRSRHAALLGRLYALAQWFVKDLRQRLAMGPARH